MPRKKHRTRKEVVRTTLRMHASTVGSFVLGVATAWCIFGIALLACPHAGLVNKVARTPVTPAPYTLAAALPTHMSIPSVGIDAPFGAPLGLNADDTVETPNSFIQVGWYKYGPTPGERGPAVVLGHVDSVLGPAVFYDLKDLEPGDRIYIEREDGTEAVFEVTQLKSVKQDNFPTDEVYGGIDFAGLRLITCTGVYDHGTLHYSHNLIVFAKLVEPEEKETNNATD